VHGKTRKQTQKKKIIASKQKKPGQKKRKKCRDWSTRTDIREHKGKSRLKLREKEGGTTGGRRDQKDSAATKTGEERHIPKQQNQGVRVRKTPKGEE